MLTDTMIAFRRFVAAAGAACLFSVSAAPAFADDIELPDPGAPVTGLSFDSSSKQVFAVSEVQGASILVADDKGERIGTVDFAAQPESVQGLAFHDGQLYVGDVGGEREQITVYQVSASEGEQTHRAFDLAYPDGAHDAKALLVSGKGRVYVITTGENPGIYHADELKLSRRNTNKMVRAADAPEGVTDATFLEDGATVVMRTAEGLVVMDAYTWETKATVKYVGAGEGESVASMGADNLLVGSLQLRKEEVPTSDGERTIGAAASPSPSAGESSAPTAQDTTQASDGATQASGTSEAPRTGGTRFAVTLAAVLAMACGLVVLLRKS